MINLDIDIWISLYHYESSVNNIMMLKDILYKNRSRNKYFYLDKLYNYESKNKNV